VTVWNRTRERAAALAHELGARAVSEPERAELLVNCTAVGLAPAPGEELGQLGLTRALIGEFETVVDLVYREGATELLAAAQAQGARTLDGLEILVAQGALSFELWTGREAPLQVMGEAARTER